MEVFMATVILQIRRGPYSSFDPSKLKPGECAVVTSGDPQSSDGTGIYICINTNNVKRLASVTEISDLIVSEIGDTLDTKVDKITGKGLSTNDFTTTEKTKLAGIASEATKVLIDTTLTTSGKAADAKAVGDKLDTKVDKVTGKDLSTNDYTTAEKTKLAELPSNISVSGESLIIN